MVSITVEQALKAMMSKERKKDWEKLKTRLLSLHRDENGCVIDIGAKERLHQAYGTVSISVQTVGWDDMTEAERNKLARTLMMDSSVNDSYRARTLTRGTAKVPIEKLLAIMSNKPAPRGRPGCGNKWCLNPDHFTTNPNKWAVAKIDMDTPLSERIVESPENLRNRQIVQDYWDDPEHAKGKRMHVMMKMSDGSITRGKIAISRVLEYLRSLDASQHTD